MLTQSNQKYYSKGSPDRKGLEAALQRYQQTREIPDIVNGKEQPVREDGKFISKPRKGPYRLPCCPQLFLQCVLWSTNANGFCRSRLQVPRAR